jgi:hypothetical protein
VGDGHAAGRAGDGVGDRHVRVGGARSCEVGEAGR